MKRMSLAKRMVVLIVYVLCLLWFAAGAPLQKGKKTSGYLTTHVLDISRGSPAGGLKIELFRLDDDVRIPVRNMVTNTDGRTDTPILPKHEFTIGIFELVFHAGAYFNSSGVDAKFLDKIPIRFGLSEENHYHVPLLLSPFGYSTYRGS